MKVTDVFNNDIKCTPLHARGEAGKRVVMRSPCAGAALDPPLWTVVPNKALSLSLSLSLSTHSAHPELEKGPGLRLSTVTAWAATVSGRGITGGGSGYARGRSSVRYGTRLGDLKENWFLLFSN